MALRSVVEQAPTQLGGGRRTVVLRAGGPKPKGGVIDVTAALFGFLLLVGSVVLVNYLPETDYNNPRYKLTFPVAGGRTPSSTSFLFVEGTSAATHIFEFEIPDDNVFSISVRLGFKDDKSASLPDEFRYQVFDPNGNPIGERVMFRNRPPAEDLTLQHPGDFIANYTQSEVTVGLHALPQEEIIEAISRDERQIEAMLRLEPATHLTTKGTYSLKVELLNAGDCPTDAGTPPDPRAARQVAACARPPLEPLGAPPSLADPGNLLNVESVTWSYYLTCTETMTAVDPKPLPSCKQSGA